MAKKGTRYVSLVIGEEIMAQVEVPKEISPAATEKLVIAIDEMLRKEGVLDDVIELVVTETI